LTSGYLFDSSSIIKALKLGKVDVLVGGYIQWLTIYETLNALWKEVHLLRTIPEDRALEFIEVLGRLFDFMKILDVRGLERGVLEVAVKLGVTVYDSSYIVLARRYGLTLVTEDRRLRAKAQEVVRCVSVDELT
jgi:predicted nucleic acid-binding protein